MRAVAAVVVESASIYADSDATVSECALSDDEEVQSVGLAELQSGYSHILGDDNETLEEGLGLA